MRKNPLRNAPLRRQDGQEPDQPGAPGGLCKRAQASASNQDSWRLNALAVRVFLILLMVFAQGCSAAGGPNVTQPASQPTEEATATPPDAPPPPPTATNTPGGPITLRVWVPPQFDPAQDTPAGRLMQARLNSFTAERPRVQLEVRVKALAGSGGLLDALTTASAAAPRAAPDLIALPRDLLETAALKGLLSPYSPSSYAEIEKDWYDYARELAHLQDSVYGLPFAGDALALAYHPSMWPQPPIAWSETLSMTGGLTFNPADPQALLTLSFYQAKGGPVRDEQSKPVIDSLTLTEVLTYYAELKNAGVINADITQLQNDEQVWAAFTAGSAPGVITWTSQFLSDATGGAADDRSLAPAPTPDGQPYTLAEGWVWSLAAHDSERQRVAVELARFLTDSAFLAQWSEAAGYLPPYPRALQTWSSPALTPMLDHIARSAHILPAGDILAAVSGPLWQATMAVLTGQSDPVTAAQQAATGLTAP